MNETVFVVIEGPDMTYYGDAQLHGVYSTREAAEARARAVDAPYEWTGQDWEPVRVIEAKVDEDE